MVSKSLKTDPLDMFCLIQIFKRRSGCKIIKQNVLGGMIVGPCIGSILKHENP